MRLPNGVFAPYTGIRTNLLFFTKGTATKDVWYYEHPYPAGVKSCNKTKPIRIDEFDAEKKWWGKPDQTGHYSKRKENEHAWRVSIDRITAGNFNLDLKNPHQADDGPGDVEQLLPEYEQGSDPMTKKPAAKKVPRRKSGSVAKAKPGDLSALLADVRNLIQSARRGVSSVIDTFQVMTNLVPLR